MYANYMLWVTTMQTKVVFAALLAVPFCVLTSALAQNTGLPSWANSPSPFAAPDKPLSFNADASPPVSCAGSLAAKILQSQGKDDDISLCIEKRLKLKEQPAFSFTEALKKYNEQGSTFIVTPAPASSTDALKLPDNNLLGGKSSDLNLPPPASPAKPNTFESPFSTLGANPAKPSPWSLDKPLHPVAPPYASIFGNNSPIAPEVRKPVSPFPGNNGIAGYNQIGQPPVSANDTSKNNPPAQPPSNTSYWPQFTHAQREGVAGVVSQGSWQLKRAGQGLSGIAEQDISKYLVEESSGLIGERTSQRLAGIAYNAAKTTIAKAPVRQGLIFIAIGAGLYAAYEFFYGEDDNGHGKAPKKRAITSERQAEPYRLQELGVLRMNQLDQAGAASSPAK